ncbi:MAG: oligosaccharide flippase family protein [Bacilli bacterium]|nr:oligosaccharide flippase family protein [Bacilli bacterium]
MKHKKELIKNTIIIAIGRCSTQVITFLLLPLYTSILSTKEYGEYDLLNTISIFAIPFITMLMEEAMFRFLIDVKDKAEKKKVISQTVIFSLISMTVASLLIFIIGSIFHYKYTLYLIFFIVGSILSGLAGSLCRGQGKYTIYAVFNFLSSFFNVFLNIIFIVVLKIGIHGLFLSYIISNSLVSLWILWRLRVPKYVSIKNLDKKLMKEMVSYSVPLVPNSVSWAIINLSDRIVITSVLGAAVNGIYSMANKFPTIINTFYNFFYMAWKESASKIVKEENKEEFYNSIYINLKHFLMAVSLVLIGVLPFVFPILIKNDYTAAYAYIPSLIISIYFSNLSSFYGGIFAAYKETKIMGSSTVWSAIINLALTLSLVHFIGVYAAIIATFVSTFSVYLYRGQKMKKYIHLEKDTLTLCHLLCLICVSLTYYYKNNLLCLFTLLVVTLYSMYINKGFVNMVLRKLKIKKA